MPIHTLETPPKAKPASLPGGATLVATNQGWTNSKTGEVLIFVKGLLNKKNSVVASRPTFNLVLPNNATYGTNQVLQFTLTTTTPVTVVGNPSLAITLTSGVVLAKYVASASTPTSLVFRYTVKKNDLALSGISLANIITLTSYASEGNGVDKIVQNVAGTAGVKLSSSNLTFTVGSTVNIKVQGL